MFTSLRKDFINGRNNSGVELEFLGSWEEQNAHFLNALDKEVFSHFDNFKSLNDETVLHNLALYLGSSHGDDARNALRKVIEISKNNEQALIWLAWHRDPRDLDFLMPYMLADTPESQSLPYHFAQYGKPGIAYLQRAAKEAKSSKTREEAAKQLQLLESSP